MEVKIFVMVLSSKESIDIIFKCRVNRPEMSLRPPPGGPMAETNSWKKTKFKNPLRWICYNTIMVARVAGYRARCLGRCLGRERVLWASPAWTGRVLKYFLWDKMLAFLKWSYVYIYGLRMCLSTPLFSCTLQPSMSVLNIFHSVASLNLTSPLPLIPFDLLESPPPPHTRAPQPYTSWLV